MDHLQYPIGKFAFDPAGTAEKRKGWIRDMSELPGKLRAAVSGLSPVQLDTPYRDGGWTVRQVVHHLADSHMNAFIRVKLAVTEEKPAITAYDQDAWAMTADARSADASLSIALIEALHARFTALLGSLAAADFGRGFLHPERGLMTVDHAVQLYAWHGRHHLAHILSLRERKGWR